MIEHQTNRRSGRSLANGMCCGLVVVVGLFCAATFAQDAQKPADKFHKLDKPKVAETPAVKPANPATTTPQPDKEKTTPAPEGSVSGPKLQIDEPVHDFGEVWVTPALSHTFEIKNVGTETLKIINVKPGCGCTVKGAYDREIPPGGTGKVPLTLKTRNLTKFSKAVTVTTNDPKNATTRVTLKGTIKYYVSATPRHIRFAKIKSNEHVKQTVKITTTEEANLELQGGGRFGPFQTTLVKLDEPNQYELTVEGIPPFKEGPNSGRIKIKTNVAKQPLLEIPVYAHVPRRLAITPSQIIIPKGVKRTRPYMVRVTNNGDTPVEVLGAKIDNSALSAEVKQLSKGKSYQVTLQVPEDYTPPPNGNKLVLTLLDGTEREHVIPILPPKPPRKPRKRPAMDLLGKPAPKTTLNLREGSTYGVGKTEQVVVLEFYTSWCGFCKRQMPNVQKAYEAFKDNPNVRFIGVSQDDPKSKGKRGRTPEEVVATFKERGMTFDLALDPQKTVGKLYKAGSYPTLFVLGKTGQVEAVHIGAKKNLAETLKKEITKLLAGESLIKAAAKGTPDATKGIRADVPSIKVKGAQDTKSKQTSSDAKGTAASG